MTTSMHPDIKALRRAVQAMREVTTDCPELRHVNMINSYLPTCGTPGCHAGLLMATLDRLGYPPIEDEVGDYYFEEEATRFAQYLGFRGHIDLECWAANNPEIWGNGHGEGMFCSSAAFGLRNNKFPSHHIVDWWEKVLQRLEANMEHPDVNRLREAIEAMKAVVAERPELHVIDIDSTYMPTCGTPGCHAGLTKCALDYLGVPPFLSNYEYLYEADRFARYLGFKEFANLVDWAEYNPTIWGNEYGQFMFTSRRAFNEDSDTFPSKHIIDWWEGVLERLEVQPPYKQPTLLGRLESQGIRPSAMVEKVLKRSETPKD